MMKYFNLASNFSRGALWATFVLSVVVVFIYSYFGSKSEQNKRLGHISHAVAISGLGLAQYSVMNLFLTPDRAHDSIVVLIMLLGCLAGVSWLIASFTCILCIADDFDNKDARRLANEEENELGKPLLVGV